MNYMTGLALGLSAGKKLHSLWRQRESGDNGAAPGFVLLHALPGRRRYRHDRLAHDPEFAAFVARHLPQMRRVTECGVNELSGTVLVHFPPEEAVYVELALQLLESLYPQKAAYGQVGRKLRGMAAAANRAVRANTGELFDLRTVFALWMLIEGGSKILIGGQRPAGPQLLWWGYSLLKGAK